MNNPTKSLQEFIRSGGYAWPGGYQCYLLMADSEALCAQCARENYRLIRQAGKFAHRACWQFSAVAIHWEGAPLQCAHCNKDIESAYGDPEGETA